jgi:hypothetical protein
MKNEDNDMKNWMVIKSRSNKHDEFGYPLGEILCKNLKDAKIAMDILKITGFSDCVIEPYKAKDASI